MEKHVKLHGKKNIRTLWISDWYYDPDQILEDALQFSYENMIVESEKWANLKVENGLDGGDCGPKGRNSTKEKLKGKVPTHALIKSMKKHMFYHSSGIVEFLTDTEMVKKYTYLSGSGLSSLRNGNLKSYHGWRITLAQFPHKNTCTSKFN